MDKGKGFVRRMLNFDTMITPSIIKIIYAIVTGIGMLIGLFWVIRGLTAPYGGGASVLAGLIVIVVSPLLIRVSCESLIVIFKINDNLNKIASNYKEEI